MKIYVRPGAWESNRAMAWKLARESGCRRTGRYAAIYGICLWLGLQGANTWANQSGVACSDLSLLSMVGLLGLPCVVALCWVASMFYRRIPGRQLITADLQHMGILLDTLLFGLTLVLLIVTAAQFGPLT